MKKLPPLEKVYEAWSVLADGRMSSENLKEEQGQATVMSSNGAKAYTVTWKPEPLPKEEVEFLREDGLRVTVPTVMTSNDSATYWQGYAGYPILAVLMAQGKLAFDAEYVKGYAGVDWTALNEQFKRDYAEAALALFTERDLNGAEARDKAEATLEELGNLPLIIKRGGTRPPKA